MAKPEVSIHVPNTWPQVIYATLIAVPIAIFGLWGFYRVSIKPVVTYLDAMSWRETPCTILSSRLTTESEISRVDILYAYVVDGQVYRSGRYDFACVHSSVGQEAKQAVVARYPSGGRTTCYVDPDDPAQAVLHPKVSTEGWWLGPAFLVFGLGSGVGLVLMYRQMLPRLFAPRVKSPRELGPGPGELRPSRRRLTRFVAPALFALVWNYAVAAFALLVLRDLRAERPVSSLGWLLLPFALAGLWLLIFAVRRMLVLFNPRPRLVLNPPKAQRGKIADLQWWISGDPAKVRRLRIVLEEREAPREEPEELVLLDSTEPDRIAAGQVSFTLPAGTKPSVWNLQVMTEIAAGPDVVDNFPVPVAF